MKQIKTTYEGIKCTTRKRTIFYLFVFFVLSFVAYRVESKYFSSWFSSITEPVRMFSSLFTALIITIGMYLFQLDSIQFELTTTIRGLLSHLRKVEPEAPGKQIQASGLHCDDELHEIIDVLNKKSTQIQSHIDYLKKLIGYIQHEFKTPLGIIQLHADRIKKNSQIDAIKPSVESIEDEIQHLSSLVESIIALLGAQDADVVNNKLSIDLGKLVRNIGTELEHIKENAEIEYLGKTSVIINNYLPFVKVILRNIIDNALTHGSDKINIILDENTISVSDQGTGISDEFSEHIRLPFWKKSSEKETSEGLGLGLSLVKELSKKLGWSIKSATNDTGGMTFTIDF